VIHLRETAGAAATIKAVDLTFMDGASVVMSSHHEDPIPATANVCPASGTVNTRELMTVDADARHPYATTVQARVAYTDVTAAEQVANGSSNVPPPAELPRPPTYALGGIISDETGRGIAGARVEVLTGANAGVVATADGTGAYAMAGLLADTFRVRASGVGYDPGEQTVTVPATRRADFTLRRPVESCAYTIAPAGPVDVPQPGGQFSVAITRVSGTCGWQAAADVGWIALTRTTGAATDTLTYTVALNPTFVGRLGVITIAWAGGSARLTVRQANDWPAFCVGTIKVGGQSSIAVPANGGQFTALIAAVPGMPPGLCSTWTASVNGPITFVGPNSGLTPGQLTFTVPPNPVAQPRVLSVLIRWDSPSSGTAGLTVNQSGTP
jgi:Carboxypeptidase regulatory-like domain/Putative binding domain, N-terminal